MKMKRIIYTLACLLLSVGAWAQNVAKIGETKYATLAEAVAAVPTDGTETTITMLEDVDLGTAYITIPATKNVVLELNGKTITGSAKSYGTLRPAGKFIINGEGTIQSTTKYAIQTTANTAAVVLNGATLESTTNSAVSASKGTFTMNSGTVSASSHAIEGGAVIKGGTVTSTNGYGVYANSSSAECVIEGGSITGAASKGAVGVYLGNVKVTSEATLNSKIVFASNATGLILPETDAAYIDNATTNLAVYDDETLLGYTTANTTETIAIGKSVKVISDITTDKSINLGATKFDLNGHNISSTAVSAIIVKAGSNASNPRSLTITGNGIVKCDNGGACNVINVERYCDVVIEGGNFIVGGEADNAVVYISNSYKTHPSIVTITDGYFESGDGKWILNCYDDAYKNNGANFVVKGGSFSADPSQFLSEGEGTNFLDEAYAPVKDADGKYTVLKAFAAKIGDIKFATLADAITAAQNGETVTLLADVTDNITIPAGKNITLDLNGKTLSGGSVESNGKKAAIVNNGTITIQDSSAEQTGTIKRDDPENYDQSNSYYVIDNQGTMTIKSGTITNNAGLTTAHKGSSLIRNGEVVEGAVLNIEGGTLTQKNFDVIKNGGKNSVLNITGGTIESENSYAILSYDKVNMSAGTVTGKVCLRSYDSDYAVANISGGTINGNITVETYPDNTPTNLSECNISGDAVINGTLSVGEGNGNTFTANDDNGIIAVSGGAFSNPVPEKYCADGFIPTDDGEGHYGVKNGSYVAQIGDVKYDTLAAAIAAAEDGTETTITLITDVIENITVPAGKNITLDLSGKTLNGKQTASTPTIKNQGTLTLTNGNVRRSGEGSASWYVIENEGTITMDEGLNVEGSANASLIRNNAVTAQMTFNDGTYTQTGAFIVVKNDLGNVVINGGTFTTADNKNVLNNWDQMTINGGTFTGNIFNGAYDKDNNKLTINDGTFNTAKISTYIGNGKTTCPIEIKGGKFTNPDMTYAATGEDDAQVAVSGGTFANPVPEKYCADGFIPKDNGDGTYGVKEGAYIARIGEQGYETLDAAIEVAKQEESATPITLLDNAETEKETLPANVTIDANSKVLTMPSFVVLDGEAYTLPKITGAKTYKVKKATYIRTNISATEWGTVCLPFSLTSGNGADYYTYDNINVSTLTVDEVATVDPHTPVVFHKAAGDLEINEENATVSLVTPVTLESGALVGTYTDANITANGNIYFINGNTFHKAQVSVKVPMYRAYINYPASGAKPDVLNLNVIGIGNADGIESVVMDATNTAEAIYDVNGRQLTAPQNGLNIMKLANGKTVKVMLK